MNRMEARWRMEAGGQGDPKRKENRRRKETPSRQ